MKATLIKAVAAAPVMTSSYLRLRRNLASLCADWATYKIGGGLAPRSCCSLKESCPPHHKNNNLKLLIFNLIDGLLPHAIFLISVGLSKRNAKRSQGMVFIGKLRQLLIVRGSTP